MALATICPKRAYVMFVESTMRQPARADHKIKEVILCC